MCTSEQEQQEAADDHFQVDIVRYEIVDNR